MSWKSIIQIEDEGLNVITMLLNILELPYDCALLGKVHSKLLSDSKLSLFMLFGNHHNGSTRVENASQEQFPYKLMLKVMFKWLIFFDRTEHPYPY